METDPTYRKIRWLVAKDLASRDALFMSPGKRSVPLTPNNNTDLLLAQQFYFPGFVTKITTRDINTKNKWIAAGYLTESGETSPGIHSVH